jgi:hypothetical protein
MRAFEFADQRAARGTMTPIQKVSAIGRVGTIDALLHQDLNVPARYLFDMKGN